MGSGLIYVVILGIWAAFLVAVLVRRPEEMSDPHSPDRFSAATRVLPRRGRRSRRRAARPPAAPQDDPRSGAGIEPRRVGSRGGPERAHRAPVLARRRRMLVALVLGTLAAAGAGLVEAVPSWSPLVPAGVATSYVVSVRRQDRRRHRLRAGAAPVRPADRTAAASAVTRPDPTPAGATAYRAQQGLAGADRPGAGDAAAAAGADRGAGWAPLPLTLPTYVTKPTAARRSRAIDLGVASPGAVAAGDRPAPPGPDRAPPGTATPADGDRPAGGGSAPAPGGAAADPPADGEPAESAVPAEGAGGPRPRAANE